MKRWKKYLQREIDIEFFSCVHACATIFLYGFTVWLDGESCVSFSMIVILMILAYLTAWIQKLLFWREKLYGRTEYTVRAVLWTAVPVFITFWAGRIFGWFDGRAGWTEPVFAAFLVVYYGMVWLFLQIFYRDEETEINRMLKEFKEHRSKDGEEKNESD
jgi:hypothetical protein